MSIKNTAINLVKKFGTTVYIVRELTGAYVDGEYIKTIDEVKINAVIMNYERFEIDNTNIKSNDLKMITTDNINDTDKIKYNDDIYNVVNIKPTMLNNTQIINEIQLRK